MSCVRTEWQVRCLKSGHRSHLSRDIVHTRGGFRMPQEPLVAAHAVSTTSFLDGLRSPAVYDDRTETCGNTHPAKERPGRSGGRRPASRPLGADPGGAFSLCQFASTSTRIDTDKTEPRDRSTTKSGPTRTNPTRTTEPTKQKNPTDGRAHLRTRSRLTRERSPD